VTRVKIYGKADDDGRRGVEAAVDGDQSFGVLQRIILRDADKDIAAANAEAQALIDENGKPDETIQLNSPDVPFLRKGDKVEVAAGNLIGGFIVLGVSHTATTRMMTMTLSRYVDPKTTATRQTSTEPAHGDFKVGDKVNFSGGSHYVSSTATTPTDGDRTAGMAKITNMAKGAAHPIHLTGISSNVYGWVNESQVSKGE
jgi:hypothetical protein